MDVSVVCRSRAGNAGAGVQLVPVCQGDRLQQSSAEGEAASRLAVDGSDLNPQANSRAEPQLRAVIFCMTLI